MRNFPNLLVLCGLSLAGAASPLPVRADPADGVSLMKTIVEWQYPGSTLLGGASMSDGGNPSMPSIKCKAVFTTPDPFEKVIAFYEEKLGTGKPGVPAPEQAGSVKGMGQSVSVLDDVEGRPLKLRVIVVNRAETSTTLVVSRAEGESKTHIAWSHQIRFSPEVQQKAGADTKMRVSLSIYSGRRDPSWEASEAEVEKFSAKFDAMKPREAQQPLESVLGYRGFLVDGFRDYDRVQIWKGTVEATRAGRTYQWDDEGRALEKYLLETSKGHVSDLEYKMGTDQVEKK